MKSASKHMPKFVIRGSININLVHPNVSGESEIKRNEYFAKSVLLVYFFIESAKNRDEKNPKIDIKITSPLTPAPLILLSAIK